MLALTRTPRTRYIALCGCSSTQGPETLRSEPGGRWDRYLRESQGALEVTWSHDAMGPPPIRFHNGAEACGLRDLCNKVNVLFTSPSFCSKQLEIQIQFGKQSFSQMGVMAGQ